MPAVIDCPSAYVVDGDSLRCGAERLRLLGIDAPELNDCPRWRTCVSGDGGQSRASLVRGLKQGRLRYRLVTRDRFGRAVVRAWAGKTDLSCWQLRYGAAIYKIHWDTGGEIGRACTRR